MTERAAGNWIQGFRFFTKESEAPDSYIFWTALSILSAAVQREIAIDWIYHEYHPNLYVVLVGPPGIVHKSSTIAFARRFLREVDVATSSEAITKEALIRQMSKRAKDDIQAISVLSSEFSSFISPSGIRMIEFLTDMFGCEDNWEYTTKGGGTDVLPRPYLTLLGGTTPSWIAEEFDIAFVEQGFAARTIFVYEAQPRFRKAFANITDEMLDMRDRLIDDLWLIKDTTGKFEWHPDAREWFREWYEEDWPGERLDYRLSGYLSRKPTHILKLSMLLTLAETSELVLTRTALTAAKEILDNLEPSMARTFSSVGKNPHASDLERIWHDIVDTGGMSDAEIRERNFHAMGKQALEEVLDNLRLMDAIKMERTDAGLYWVPKGEGPEQGG